jgi:formate dehydrogenase beta subunit
MDCCRTARRIVKPGCQVTVAYRRIEASAPADPEEIHAARAEGIRFEFLSAPKRILVENGRVVGIELVRMHQTEPDASGRRAVKPLPGSEFIIPCSYVIAAIGQKMDPTVFTPEDGIALTRWGTIETKENFTTTREGVFAGGDAATGPKTLILAMAQGEALSQHTDTDKLHGMVASRPVGAARLREGADSRASAEHNQFSQSQRGERRRSSLRHIRCAAPKFTR